MADSHLTITPEEYSKFDAQFSTKPSDYTKPIRFYCDVDGVIKPGVRSQEELDRRFPNAVEIDVLPPFSHLNPLPLHKGRFWWDEQVIDRLAALSRSPHVDFVWLTDWRVSAPHALDKLLGIQSIGFLDWERKFSDYNQVFKRYAILDEQKESSSKFIWVDDRANRPYGGAPHVFSEEKDGYEWEYDENGDIVGDVSDGYTDLIPASQYLNVITDNNAGLTLQELDMIEKWIKNNI